MSAESSPTGPSVQQLPQLLRAAMAVLQAADGQMNIVLLNKMLFYWDLNALLETGKSLTGSTYLAMRQGPVVASYERRLRGALIKAGLVEEVQDTRSKPLRVKVPLELALSAQEKTLLDETFALAKKHDWTSSKASEYSHQNPGWQIAWEQTQHHNGSAQPIDLHIAMQQLDEDDPWLSAPLTDEEQKAFEDSEAEPSVPWN